MEETLAELKSDGTLQLFVGNAARRRSVQTDVIDKTYIVSPTETPTRIRAVGADEVQALEVTFAWASRPLRVHTRRD